MKPAAEPHGFFCKGSGVSEALRAKFGFSGILLLEKLLTPVTTEEMDRGGCVTAETAYRDSGSSLRYHLTAALILSDAYYLPIAQSTPKRWKKLLQSWK